MRAAEKWLKYQPQKFEDDIDQISKCTPCANVGGTVTLLGVLIRSVRAQRLSGPGQVWKVAVKLVFTQEFANSINDSSSDEKPISVVNWTSEE